MYKGWTVPLYITYKKPTNQQVTPLKASGVNRYMYVFQ